MKRGSATASTTISKTTITTAISSLRINHFPSDGMVRRHWLKGGQFGNSKHLHILETSEQSPVVQIHSLLNVKFSLENTTQNPRFGLYYANSRSFGGAS